MIIRGWSYYTLSSYFTFVLGTRKDHRLISNGPYKYLAHPSYLGQILIGFGSLLFLSVHWLFLIIPIMGVISLRGRMEAEELMMKEKFGEEYSRYLRKRWHLIPFIY